MTKFQAVQHLRRLLLAANHRHGCEFCCCSCGKAQEHSDAQLDANKALREDPLTAEVQDLVNLPGRFIRE